MANRPKAKKNNNEITGIILIIVSAVLLLCLIYPDILSVIGHGIYKFLTGALGVFAYALFSVTLLGGVFMFRGYRLMVGKKRLSLIIALSATGLFLLQLVSSHRLLILSMGDYLKSVYNFSENITIAGALGGVFAYGAKAALTTVGSYILFCLAFAALAVLLSLDISNGRRPVKEGRRNYKKKGFVKGNSVAAPIMPIVNNGLFIENIIPKGKRVDVDGGSYSKLNDNDKKIQKREILTSERGNLYASGNDDLFESLKKPKEPETANYAKSILFSDYDKMLEDSTSRFIKRNKAVPDTVTCAPITNYDGLSATGSPAVSFGSASVYTYQNKEIEPEPAKKAQKTLPEVVFPPDKEPKPENPDGILDAEEISCKLSSVESHDKKDRSVRDNGFGFLSNEYGGDKDSLYFDDGYNFVDKSEQAAKFLSGTVPFAAAAPFIKKSGNVSGNATADIPANKTSGDINGDINNDIINCDEYQDIVAANDKSVVSFSNGSANEFYPSSGYSVNTIEYIDDTHEPSAGGRMVYGDDGSEYQPFSQYFSQAKDNRESKESYVQEDKQDGDAYMFLDDTFKADQAFHIGGDIFTEDSFQANNDGDEIKADENEHETVQSQNNESRFSDIEQLLTNDEYRSEPVKTAKNYNYKELYGQKEKTAPFSEQSVNADEDFYNSVIDESPKKAKEAIKPLDPVGQSFLERVERLERAKNPQTQQKTSFGLFRFDDVDEPDEVNEPVEAVEAAETAKPVEFSDSNNDAHKNDVHKDSAHKRAEKEIAARQIKTEPDQINIENYLSVSNSSQKTRPLLKTLEYNHPPVSLLTGESTDPDAYGEDCEHNAMLLEETLKNLKLPAKVKGITRGPAVTRYELEMPSGATVKRIEGFSQDIAYALASNSGIRIEAPIPGKRAVGVEVPNRSIGIVALKDLIASPEFNKNASPLTLCIGKDIGASTVLCNLEKMPHLLIAGSTGSGKSACLHSLIISMLYKASPADLRLLLIDPKRVEFPAYKNLPHLLINAVINEREHAVNALKWAREEMEVRYRLMAKYNARNIQEYNMSKQVRDGEEQKLPYIVVIIDELSDLMISESKKEIEEHITSIAQKARAAGMHLILATQRPSVNVITGTIKVNFPSRIAFAVSNGVDSKTILDRGGAEMLLGRGDLLYSPVDYPDPSRVQGSYVVKEEVEAVVDYIIKNNQAEFDEEAASFILKTKESEESRNVESNGDEEYDVLLEDVARKIIETNQASAVMLQRRFKLGYARAARILDQMEQLGFIGPLDFNRTKPREIFITKETFKEFFGKDY